MPQSARSERSTIASSVEEHSATVVMVAFPEAG
jgi:hypothetical protein